MGKWLLDKALECVTGAFDGICEWLGIKSPSRRAKEVIGKNWIKGTAEGFEEETPNLVKTATKNTRKVFDATKKEVASRFVSSAQSRAYDHPAFAFAGPEIDDFQDGDDDAQAIINNTFIVDGDKLVEKTTKATIKKISHDQKGKGRYKK